ncbi:MAG: hypothetical protein LQ347_004872 [Umbilicaria vellea]|nr:MAG: hypothetical protein LQ347_004872 [Umbilicaria vellea]
MLTLHQELLAESRKHGVFVFIEHHKRFDPAYSDAKARAKGLGHFNYFYSYMSQSKSQLETFKAWAGKDSDISYYLNSHHLDISEWMVPEYRPVKVTASGSKGTSEDLGHGQIMWYNPFYMKYSPDEEGNFNGQTGYGYISFEKFVDSVTAFKEGKVTLDDLDKRGLPTLKNTIATTAILEAGRRSLDENRTVQILEENGEWTLK